MECVACMGGRRNSQVLITKSQIKIPPRRCVNLLIIYGLFNMLSVAQTIQSWMTGWLISWKDVERSCHTLIWGTILAFAWRGSEKLQKQTVTIDSTWLQFEPATSLIHICCKHYCLRQLHQPCRYRCKDTKMDFVVYEDVDWTDSG
jgi:hypothetical protein